ncbi:MAG: ABC transporter substrate-binding protein [bacterium]|nr:ABC transporter substrate-binding protein [bacterium]
MDKRKLGYGLRQVAAYGALVTLGLLSIGCSKKATPATTNETPTMTVWQSDFTLDSVEQAIDELDAKTVVIKQRQLKPDIFESRSVDAIAGDEAPDVWIIPDDWLEDHRNKLVSIPDNFIQPDKKKPEAPKNIHEYFQQNYASFVNDRLLTNDGALGFPGPVKPLVLFVNKDLLSQTFDRWRKEHPNSSIEERSAISKLLSAPITTWNDLVTIVKLITLRDGTNIQVSGIGLGTANNVPNLTEIFALLDYQQGNDFIDIAKQVALFNGFITQSDGIIRYPGRDALSFITQFADPTKDTYTWNATMPNAREAFLAGKVALILDYPDFAGVIKQQKKRVQYEQYPVPQLLTESNPVNVVRYYIVAPTKASADYSKAITVANGLVSANNIGQLARGINGSYTPYKARLSQDKDVTRLFTGARFVYKKHHAEFDTIMSRMIDDVSVRGQAVDVVVNQAANDITALLQRND